MKSWRKFRRRARCGVPGPRSPKVDKAVHDLRSAARRLHSVARSLSPAATGKAVRRAAKIAERILDWTGSLRDVAVEREGLKAVLRRDSKVARGLVRDLNGDHDRQVRRVSRRLRSLKLGKAHRSLRKFSRRLRRDHAARDIAADMVESAFDDVRQARIAADPTDARSVHRLRIALKRFRHVVEVFEPVLPPARGERTASVHSLQRTMGDLRDNELLSSALSSHGKGDPGRLPATAAALVTLDRRHSEMMTSFLKSVDAILQYWDGLVESFRRGLSGPPRD